MIIQFHTPQGMVQVDSDTVTDKKLSGLGLTRKALNDLVRRDPLAEIDELKVRVEKLENK